MMVALDQDCVGLSVIPVIGRSSLILLALHGFIAYVKLITYSGFIARRCCLRSPFANSSTTIIICHCYLNN